METAKKEKTVGKLTSAEETGCNIKQTMYECYWPVYPLLSHIDKKESTPDDWYYCCE
jgi:hypothetical protein